MTNEEMLRTRLECEQSTLRAALRERDWARDDADRFQAELKAKTAENVELQAKCDAAFRAIAADCERMEATMESLQLQRDTALGANEHLRVELEEMKRAAAAWAANADDERAQVRRLEAELEECVRDNHQLERDKDRLIIELRYAKEGVLPPPPENT